MISAGQVAAPGAAAESFSETQGNQRIVDAIERLEGTVNEGLEPTDPLYIHVSALDMTAGFRRITGLTVSPRNSTAFLLADAIGAYADSNPRVFAGTAEEREEQVVNGFVASLESNMPPSIISELKERLADVYGQFAQNFERQAARLNDPAVWDEYLEGLDYLNLVTQSLVLVDALGKDDIRHEDLRALERLSELIIHNDTEAVGTGILSLITRNAEGRIAFPKQFADLVEMAATTVDYSSMTNLVRSELEHNGFSTSLSLGRIVNTAEGFHIADGAREAALLSVVTMLSAGETGLAQRFLKVMADSESAFSPAGAAEEVQIQVLTNDVFMLAILASVQDEMGASRRSLVDRTLELISKGFEHPLTPIEYQMPELAEKLLASPLSYPEIEEKLVEIFDRALNPIYDAEQRNAYASMLMAFFMGVNDLYETLAGSGLPQDGVDYAAVHSVVADLLEFAASQSLDAGQMDLIEKALVAEANDNLELAMIYRQRLLNRQSRNGNGGRGGSSGSSAPTSGPATPSATTPPAEGEAASGEITAALSAITYAGDAAIRAAGDRSGDISDGTAVGGEVFGGDAAEEGAEIMRGAPFGVVFEPAFAFPW